MLKNNRTYNSWRGMRDRCLNPNHEMFYLYGGAGITCSDSWSRYSNFLEDMGEAPIGMSIDRIKNEKGYCKENCRWATSSQQAANRRPYGKTGFKGVHLRNGKYAALFYEHGKQFSLGTFDDPKIAAALVDVELIRIYGEFALTNASIGLL